MLSIVQFYPPFHLEAIKNAIPIDKNDENEDPREGKGDSGGYSRFPPGDKNGR
jgi:hypothetical protein